MPIEQELENISSSHKEFKSLLEQDFKDRKLKEKGIEAFDFQMAIRVRELDIDEVNPINDNFANLDKPPF